MGTRKGGKGAVRLPGILVLIIFAMSQAMVFFFERLGIGSDTVQIRVNSRKVLDTVTTSCGVAKEDFAKVCVILDKLDKIGPSLYPV